MGDWTPENSQFSELGLRVASAVVLIPIAFVSVWYGGWLLAIFCAILAALMAWEWAKMGGVGSSWLVGVPAVLACLSLLLEPVWLSPAILAAGVTLNFVIRKGGLRARSVAGFGVLYVFALSGSLLLLRDGAWDGRELALYVMCFVWASDASAYFTGRSLGGPRLLPSESPNKTWSGAIGAFVACIICGILVSLLEHQAMLVWAIFGGAVSVVAQVGDLFESGLKRRFKVKDSSALLPGHGGVLDRVDGLGAACLFAVVLFYANPMLTYFLGVGA